MFVVECMTDNVPCKINSDFIVFFDKQISIEEFVKQNEGKIAYYDEDGISVLTFISMNLLLKLTEKHVNKFYLHISKETKVVNFIEREENLPYKQKCVLYFS